RRMCGDRRALPRARTKGEGVRGAGGGWGRFGCAGRRAPGPRQGADRPLQISARDRVRGRAAEDRDREAQAERVEDSAAGLSRKADAVTSHPALFIKTAPNLPPIESRDVLLRIKSDLTGENVSHKRYLLIACLTCRPAAFHSSAWQLHVPRCLGQTIIIEAKT